MARYFRHDLVPLSRPPSPSGALGSDRDGENDMDGPDNYDRHRNQLLTEGSRNESWRSELNRYLSDVPADVTKETDIVAWWGVRTHACMAYSFANNLQVHSKIYPTLSRIALDVLAAQASSVPCERLFSAGKEIADDRRARLGPECFEHLQMLKFEWKGSTVDFAAWNSEEVEDVRVDEYTQMLNAELVHVQWDSDIETHLLE
jgi:hypothetical protein